MGLMGRPHGIGCVCSVWLHDRAQRMQPPQHGVALASQQDILV